jgi:hypothetical protein
MPTTKIKVNAGSGWEYFKIDLVYGFCKHFLMNSCVISPLRTVRPIYIGRAYRYPLDVAFYILFSTTIRTVFVVGRPTRPQTQHDCDHDMKVKPEAATAVIELLMMGGKTPETC